MTALAEIIAVRTRGVRSVSLERDLGSTEPLDGYVPSAPALDAAGRAISALSPGPRTRAFSLTGPYGGGKSAFAHLLTAVLGPRGETRQVAEALLEPDDGIARGLARHRELLTHPARGAVCAVATAQREPIATTVLRALRFGAARFRVGRAGRAPGVLRALEAASDDAEDGHPVSGDVVLSLFDELAELAPVMLVVDEFGKNLEYAAGRDDDGDLFVAQQLAERLSSAHKPDGVFLTVQHLAFEDYLEAVSDTRRREWRKVQGRFEDVPFVAEADFGIRLAGRSLVRADGPSAFWDGVDRSAAIAQQHLARVAPDAPSWTEKGPYPYPMHPAALACLPALAARLGQHERSLIGFLTGEGPTALRGKLTGRIAASPPWWLRVEDLYEFFVQDAAVSGGQFGGDGVRVREVAARVTAATGTGPLELSCLKTIATLNVAAVPGLAAGRELVTFAVADVGAPARKAEVEEALMSLERRGLVMFRDFADEYRVWEGTDVDVDGLIAAARERLGGAVGRDERLQRIASARPPRPAVARRHSQQTEVLRYFETRYATVSPTDPPALTDPQADGLLLWVLDDTVPPDSAASRTVCGRPVLVVWSGDAREVHEAALEAEAARSVLVAAEALDPVARRELRHRASAAQAAVAGRIERAFGGPDTLWFAQGERRPAGTPAQLSRLLSDMCDETYPDGPVLRTEMLSRRELTSQGAKTRRELIERMFGRADEPQLGITGYGPDRAMYGAVLEHTGLHRERQGQGLVIGPPSDDSGLKPAWTTLMRFFDAAVDELRPVEDLYSLLKAPPYGMKDGPIPVLLVAGLIHRSHDVLIFEDGTLQPTVSAEHLERLVKAPSDFSVKRAALTGTRGEAFQALQRLADELGGAGAIGREPTTLSVVRPLIGLAAALPQTSRRTRRISKTAQAVRDALLAARDPDALLFSELAVACGAKPFAPIPEPTRGRVERFERTLRGALDELAGSYPALLEDIAAVLQQAFRTAGGTDALREELRVRARHLEGRVIAPQLRALVALALDSEFDDREWLEAVALNVYAKPPSVFNDDDLIAFTVQAHDRAGAFRRIEALHYGNGQEPAGGFTSRQVTLTWPDGRETVELLAVQDGSADAVNDLVDRVLSDADSLLGEGKRNALLAVLAERVLPAPAAVAPNDISSTAETTGTASSLRVVS